MTHSDFPACFQTSDNAALFAQRKYISILKIDMAAMITALLFAFAMPVLSSLLTAYDSSGYVIPFLPLLPCLILTIIFVAKKNENIWRNIWYQQRALAEAAKALTWRFICCPEDIKNALSADETAACFIESIEGLVNESKGLSQPENDPAREQPVIKDCRRSPIANKMTEIRSYDLQNRKNYYIQNRINDQKNWYAGKAMYNKQKYNLWFGIMMLSQGLAVVSIVMLTEAPYNDWNYIRLLTTVAASALSLLQLKRHQKQEQAYTAAKNELTFIDVYSEQINSESRFLKFVSDAEHIMYKEHALWLAQMKK